MRQRDIFEAACHEAITKLRQDIADGVWHVTADNKCADRILKAWERSVAAAAKAGQDVAAKRREAAIQPLVQAVQRIKADAS